MESVTYFTSFLTAKNYLMYLGAKNYVINNDNYFILDEVVYRYQDKALVIEYNGSDKLESALRKAYFKNCFENKRVLNLEGLVFLHSYISSSYSDNYWEKYSNSLFSVKSRMIDSVDDAFFSNKNLKDQAYIANYYAYNYNSPLYTLISRLNREKIDLFETLTKFDNKTVEPFINGVEANCFSLSNDFDTSGLKSRKMITEGFYFNWRNKFDRSKEYSINVGDDVVNTSIRNYSINGGTESDNCYISHFKHFDDEVIMYFSSTGDKFYYDFKEGTLRINDDVRKATVDDYAVLNDCLTRFLTDKVYDDNIMDMYKGNKVKRMNY